MVGRKERGIPSNLLQLLLLCEFYQAEKSRDSISLEAIEFHLLSLSSASARTPSITRTK